MFNEHPAFRYSREVLKKMIGRSELGGSASVAVTEALRRELILKDVQSKADELRQLEGDEEWADVGRLYRVIDSDTETVVVDPELVERITAGARVTWQELVKGSVQIWRKKVLDLGIRQLDRDGDLFYWTGPYDPDFLGYMAGVLPLIQGKHTGLFA
jgi:hypothetical protein